MIKITIPQKQAILNGSAQWGKVPISDATFENVLSILSLEERDRLHVDSNDLLHIGGGRVEARSTDIEDIVEAIRVTIAEVIATARKKLDEVISYPDKCFDYEYMRRNWVSRNADIELLAATAGLDPSEAIAAVEACQMRLVKHWECEASEALRTGGLVEIGGRTIGRSDVRQIAKKYNMSEIISFLDAVDEVETVAKTSEAVWLDWAREHGSDDLKLAIRDEYPLGDAVKREVLGHLFPEGESVDRVERSDDRRVPNAAARALKEKLERAISKDCQAIEGYVGPPKGTEIAVGRIQSIEIYVPCECQGEAYCDKCDDDLEVKVKRTAVPVYAKAPHCDAARWYLVTE